MKGKNMRSRAFEVGYKIYSNRLILAVRRGFLKVQHLILVGCIVNIIINFPLPHYKEFMINTFGDNFIVILGNILFAISSIVKILSIVTISYSLANYHKIKLKVNDINPMIVSTVAVLSNYILISNNKFVIFGSFTAKEAFYSIVITLVSTEMFIFFWKQLNRNLSNIKGKYDRALNQSLNSFFPTIITICLLIAVKYILASLEANAISTLSFRVSNFLENTSELFVEVYNVLKRQILWFIGAQGGDIVNLENVVDRTYIDTFVNIGGAGATISLLIAIFIVKGTKYSHAIGKISILPSIFNVNEILLYGLPIMFNPIYLIPFVLTPVILTFVTYLFFYSGFIQTGVGEINWATPVFINSYIITGTIKGCIVQGINLIIGTAIYLPFVKLADRMYIRELNESYSELKNIIYKNNIEKASITLRDDNVGRVGVLLGADLTRALDEGKGLYLQYQPQVDKNNKVVGVEALLRWNHEYLKNIPPNITVLIAEEIGEIHRLGNFVTKEALKGIAKINESLDENITISINASPYQLKNREFSDFIKGEVEKNNIDPNLVKVEITENLALGEDKITKIVLKELSDYGIKLVIDDFGPGYNPILYIKKYNIHCIKLDGSLIRDVDKNKESKEIVSAMYTLCERSNLLIVSEFVETESQKKILDSLGDGVYQGYLFSPAVDIDECISYIKINTK